MFNTRTAHEPTINVLLVEYEAAGARWAERALEDSGLPISVQTVASLESALHRLETNEIHVVLLVTGTADGTAFPGGIARIHAIHPTLPVIIYSASTFDQSGLPPIDKGVLYFLSGRETDPATLTRTVHQAVETARIQENLRHIIDSNGDGVAIFSTDRELLFANPTAVSLLEFSPHNPDYVFPYPLNTHRVSQIELAGKRIELHVSPIEWDGSPALLAKLHDPAGPRTHGAQSHEANKMEAVRALANRVARDLGPMLAAIDRFIGLAQESPPTSSARREHLADIANVTERASGLLHRLQTFGGEDRRSPRPISLDDIITNSHAILHRLVGDNIDLVLTTTTGSKNIIADPARIERLLINLVVNACDAMPKGGKLNIETTRVRLGEDFDPGQFPRPEPGEYLLLVIADTGIGMDEDTMRQIFLPLFTTKPPGHGAGMGLATTYGIVRQNGGAIQVQSKPGEGTVMRVYFPCAGEGQEARARHARAAGFGDETVLLVDDESSIRMYTSRVLASRGYRVIEARSPAEALGILRQGDTKIDLVVTDIVMPGMNGRELSNRLQSMLPRLPVLFLSGFSHEVVLREGILDAQMRFLKKPFSPNDLVMQVRKALDDDQP